MRFVGEGEELWSPAHQRLQKNHTAQLGREDKPGGDGTAKQREKRQGEGGRTGEEEGKGPAGEGKGRASKRTEEPEKGQQDQNKPGSAREGPQRGIALTLPCPPEQNEPHKKGEGFGAWLLQCFPISGKFGALPQVG